MADGNTMASPGALAQLLALLPGDVPRDELAVRLDDGRAQIWAGNASAAVTEITEDGVLRIWLAGGDIRDLLSGLPVAEALARRLGLRGVETEGRDGWRRVLARFGFRLDDGGERLIKWL